MKRKKYQTSTNAEDFAPVYNNIKKSIPLLWFGHLINGKPIPWENILIDGIIINAFEIFQKKTVFRKLLNGSSIKEILPDSDYLNISLDSGGFLFQKSPEIELPFTDFIKIIKNSLPDFVYALDHPLDPSMDKLENDRRIKKTLENTRKMNEEIQEIPVIPILHGYTKTQLTTCAEGIKKIYGSKPQFIACGSLVPLMRTGGSIRKYYLDYWNTESRRVMAIRILKYARKLFPCSVIHVFGIGGTNIMHLMYLIADSVDSIGWRWSAANGMVRIFNVGERYISKRNKSVKWNPNPSESEWNILKECKCPICKDDQDRLFESFEARAVHNAFVYQQESNLAKDLKKSGKYHEYLLERLQNNNSLKRLINEFPEFQACENYSVIYTKKRSKS